MALDPGSNTWLARYLSKAGGALFGQKEPRPRGRTGLDHPNLPIPRDDPAPYPANTSTGGALPGRGGAMQTRSPTAMPAIAQAPTMGPPPNQPAMAAAAPQASEAPAFAPLSLAQAPSAPALSGPPKAAPAPQRAAQAAPAGKPAEGPPQGGPKIDLEEIWKVTPPEQKEQQLGQLEQQLGDIDKAYANLAEKMGERPSEKLTREDKGLLLMEFGLHLTAYSAAGRHGADLGGAVGDAGLDALQSFKELKAKKKSDVETYDRTMGAIGTARVKARGEATKEDVANRKSESEILENNAQTARMGTEQGKLRAETAKIQAEAEGRGEKPPHWIVHDDADGNSYAFDVNGGTKTRLGKTPPGGGPNGSRPYEFQVKYDLAMQLYGTNADGSPKTGADLRAAQKQALDVANRTQTMTQGEAYQTSMEMAMKLQEAGQIPYGAEPLEEKRAEIEAKLMAGAAGPQGDQDDVSSSFNAEQIQQLPEGEEVTNSEGVTVVRRGNKVYFVGQR